MLFIWKYPFFSNWITPATPKWVDANNHPVHLLISVLTLKLNHNSITVSSNQHHCPLLVFSWNRTISNSELTWYWHHIIPYHTIKPSNHPTTITYQSSHQIIHLTTKPPYHQTSSTVSSTWVAFYVFWKYNLNCLKINMKCVMH